MAHNSTTLIQRSQPFYDVDGISATFGHDETTVTTRTWDFSQTLPSTTTVSSATATTQGSMTVQSLTTTGQKVTARMLGHGQIDVLVVLSDGQKFTHQHRIYPAGRTSTW
jgi:hypothetical protein